MGLYQRHVVPRLVNRACGSRALVSWRRRACEGLSGEVVDIGFGTGHNVPYYPAEVTLVHAVEPAALAWRLARARVAASRVKVHHVGLDGGALPLGDASCDAALITFTLCTVPDPARVLGEVARVLRPGGRLHLLEHGLAPDARVARWQRRLDGIEQRLADGCHLTRDPRALLAAAGFVELSLEQAYAPGPKPWGYLTLVVATAPPPLVGPA